MVPSFNDPEHDELALRTLQGVFPDRKVVQIHAGREILLGGGNVHCITVQQPFGENYLASDKEKVSD